MSEWRELGRVKRLQVQERSLKVESEPLRYYDPAPIVASDVLQVADSRVTVDAAGESVLDVHCASHPESRNRGNGNMLSVLFTGHYDKMREEFGSHLVEGIAGENILVECDRVISLDDVQGGLRIEGEEARTIDFGEIAVAAPCVEFSRFCLNDREADPQTTSVALRFLGGGTRGFYAYINGGLPTEIQLGDRLLARV